MTEKSAVQNQSSAAPAPESAIDEKFVLKALFEDKIKIAAITFLAAVIAAGLTLLLPNSYESSSAIIIKEPEIPVTGEVPPLKVETLRDLVESTTVKMTAFEELKRERLLEPDAEYRKFAEALNTWTPREATRDGGLLPMIRLSARSKDADTATAIANRWADVALKKTREIHAGGVDELTSFTRAIYEKADQQLIASEDAFTSAMLAAQLAVSKSRMEANNKIYGALYAEILKLSEEANTQQATLEEMNTRLLEQEIDDVWVGEIYNQHYRNGENEAASPPASSMATQAILLTVKNIVRNEAVLSKYEQESQLQFMQLDLKNYETQLAYVAEQVLFMQNNLAKSETQHKELQTALVSLDPKITLSKAITNDVLWEMYFNNRLSTETLKKQGIPSLRTEESNPVYEKIQQRVIELSGDITGLKSQVTYFEAQKETLKTEVSNLASEITIKNARREALIKAIAKDEAMFKFMEEEYNKLRQRYETTKLLHQETLSTVAAKTSDSVRLEEEIARLEKQVFTAEDRTNALKRQVDSRVLVRTSLAAKAEEVALLRVSLENVSRSGATLLYEATTNPDKVAPGRTRMVLLATAVALIISACFFVLIRIVREE